MPHGAPTVECVACGTPTPRSEMFGAGTDLRCGDCAHNLRERLHPAKVRRGVQRLHGSDGRASAAFLAFLVVLFIGLRIDPVARHLLPLIIDFRTAFAADGTEFWRPAGAWMPALWAVSHFDLWHILLNGLFFWRTSKWVELGWGPWTMLFLVLGSGISGCAAGWLITGAPTVGASGGAFGILGWLIAQRRHHVIAQAIVTPYFWHAIAANVVLMVVLTEFGGLRISHVAHGVGFVFGFLAGWALTQPWRALGFAVLGVLPALLCYLTQTVEPLSHRA